MVTKPSVKDGITFVDWAKAEVQAAKALEEEAGLAQSKSWQQNLFKQAGGATAVDVTVQVAEVEEDVTAVQAAEEEKEEEEKEEAAAEAEAKEEAEEEAKGATQPIVQEENSAVAMATP